MCQILITDVSDIDDMQKIPVNEINKILLDNKKSKKKNK
jgi:hypothetical protein